MTEIERIARREATLAALRASPGYDGIARLVRTLRREAGLPFVVRGFDGRAWSIGLEHPEPGAPTPEIVRIPLARALTLIDPEIARDVTHDVIAQLDHVVEVRRARERAAREGSLLLPRRPEGA